MVEGATAKTRDGIPLQYSCGFFSEGPGKIARWTGLSCGRCDGVDVDDGGDRGTAGADGSASERGLRPRGVPVLFIFSPSSVLAGVRNGEKRTRFRDWRAGDRLAVKSHVLESKKLSSHIV